MIKLLITLSLLFIPLLFVYLNITHPEVQGKYFFTFFILLATLERLWGTFYSQKGDDTRKFHGDWTLAATTFAYFIVVLLMIFSFYQTNVKNFYLVIIGVSIFIFGVFYRFYSVKSLGEQWNIHISEKYKIKNSRRLIIKGPYKLSRHPIYFSAIIELIGLSLIINSYIFIFVVLFFNAPLMIWRSIYEEKQSIKIFGDEYVKYKKRVSFMIPWKFFIKK